MLNETSRVRRPLPACTVCHSPTTNMASRVCNGCQKIDAARRELDHAIGVLLWMLDNKPDQVADCHEAWAVVRASRAL